MGAVDEEVIGLAEELGAALIVMGSRGLGAMRRTLMGSVSDSMLKHAHCPVLIVREGNARDLGSAENQSRSTGAGGFWSTARELGGRSAPGEIDLPEEYRFVGQPVLVPGDMGGYSFVLAGTEGAMRETFGSSAHGAGRKMSRHRAKREAKGRNIIREMGDKEIVVRAAQRGAVDEEISEAYKNVADVVEVIHGAGISRKVARLRPIIVVKG